MKSRKHVAISSGMTERTCSLGLHLQRWNKLLPEDVQLNHWEEETNSNHHPEPAGVVVEVLDEAEVSTAFAHRLLWYLGCQDEDLPAKPAILLVPAVKDGASSPSPSPFFHSTPLEDDLGTRDDAICKEITSVWAQHRDRKFSACCLRSRRSDDPLLLHFDACKRIFHYLQTGPLPEYNEWRLIRLNLPTDNEEWNVKAQITGIVNAVENARRAHLFYCIANSLPPALDDATSALAAEHPGWRTHVVPLRGGEFAYCLQQPRPTWTRKRTLLPWLRGGK